MYNFKITGLIVGLVFVTVISSCKKIVDSFPPRYSFNLMFTDQDGNNLLNSAPNSNLEKDIVASSIDGEIVTSTISVLESANGKYLHVDLSSRPGLNLSRIDCSIQNRELMGDDQVHIINIYWRLKKNNNTIIDLKFNGKSINQIKEPIVHYKITKAL
jgi:hypothetical protein